MTENYKVTALISAEWQGVALRWEGAFCLMRLGFTPDNGFIILPPRLIIWPLQRLYEDHLMTA
jgi:hypothetical protein